MRYSRDWMEVWVIVMRRFKLFLNHEQIQSGPRVLHHRLLPRGTPLPGRVRLQSSQDLRTHRHRHPRPRLRRPPQREESPSTTHSTQDRFIDPNTVTSIHNVTPKLGALTIGLARTCLSTQLTAATSSPVCSCKQLTTRPRWDTTCPWTTWLPA